MQSLLILGRQPALGLAELESLFGSAHVRPAGNNAALLDVTPEDVVFFRLGGSVKACKLLATLETTDWNKLENYLIKQAPDHAARLPEGKLTIGLSVYGIKITPGKLNAVGLSIKKAIRKTSGRSVRLVPNNDTELSSAQIFHNHLTDANGWELVLVADGPRTHLAQTFAVQDIDSYTLRDRGRPKRDARVGMLPPKLAQIIINLAVGSRHQALSTSSSNLQPSDSSLAPTIILDPFCGTGVVLQEASLMGYRAYGTDLEPRMVDYSRANLDWLRNQYSADDFQFELQTGDATSHRWDFTPLTSDNATIAVACETYLGKPFTSRPAPDVLAKTTSEVDLILKKFLKNIRKQLPPGTRFCLAVPAWNLNPQTNDQKTTNNHASESRNSFRHLPLVDQISDLGYTRVSFEHVRDDQLLYYREDQVVARQLLVLQTI